MSASPSFQFYASDFLASTADLLPSEVGAYIRLLCHQWDKGHVPEPERMVLVAGGEVSKEVLDKFPICGDGKRRNQRLEAVRDQQERYREAQRTRGQAGAAARWNGKDTPEQCPSNAPAMAQALPKHSPSNGTSIAQAMPEQWPDDGSPTPSPTPTPISNSDSYSASSPEPDPVAGSAYRGPVSPSGRGGDVLNRCFGVLYPGSAVRISTTQRAKLQAWMLESLGRQTDFGVVVQADLEAALLCAAHKTRTEAAQPDSKIFDPLAVAISNAKKYVVSCVEWRLDCDYAQKRAHEQPPAPWEAFADV